MKHKRYEIKKKKRDKTRDKEFMINFFGSRKAHYMNRLGITSIIVGDID